jgi:hypothetical protein
MKSITVFCLSIFLFACSSVPLTEEGKKVRAINPDWSNQCEFITTEEIVSNRGYSPSDCKAKAFYIMKNRVAELGGNAYVKVNEVVSTCLGGGTVMAFEVFLCPTKSHKQQKLIK